MSLQKKWEALCLFLCPLCNPLYTGNRLVFWCSVLIQSFSEGNKWLSFRGFPKRIFQTKLRECCNIKQQNEAQFIG